MIRYRADNLPALKGPAAWNVLLGAQPEYGALESSETADFVIIGGGFAGLSAARRLSQLHPDATIVVLEAGRIADSSAGRNSGFMIDLPHELTSDDYAGSGDDRAVIALNRHAIAFGREAVEDYGIDPNFFDEAGKINGAVSTAAQRHNVTYAKHLDSLGERSEVLDAQHMQEVTGSAHYRSGLYTPGTVMLQPAGYIRGLAAGLSAAGVMICENSAALRFERQGNSWKVQTAKGAVSAPRVILANNGHLESFGFERGRLMQLFLYASMSEELDAEALRALGGQPRWGITPSDPMGTTMRRIDTGQGGNRIVTRTCAILRPSMKPTGRDIRRTSQVQRRKFEQRFPNLKTVRTQYAWAGHLCLSMNGVTVTKELDQGIFSACVQNGLGTARGTLTGIAAAEMACGASSPVTAHFSNEARPTRLPPQPFRQIGANAVLRYKEWRARDE